MKQIQFALVAGIVCFLVVMGLATGYASASLRGLSAHSSGLVALTLLTMPLAAVTSFLSLASRGLAKRTGPFLMANLYVVGSAAIAVVWSLAASLWLWPLLRNVDQFLIPYIAIWSAGSLAGLLLLHIWRGHVPASDVPNSKSRVVVLSLTTLYLLVVVPLVFAALAVVQFVLSFSVFTETAVFLVPAGYEGPLLILYDEPDGAPVHYEGRARLYKFPVSGVLRTQFGPSRVASASQAYYVDEFDLRLQTLIVDRQGCDAFAPQEPVIVCALISTSLTDGLIVGPMSNRQTNMDALLELYDSTEPLSR